MKTTSRKKEAHRRGSKTRDFPFTILTEAIGGCNKKIKKAMGLTNSPISSLKNCRERVKK